LSKAFTREDDQPEPEPPRPLPSVLPPGAKNYLTPDGAARFKAELVHATDDRIRELRRILESAVIVGPPSENLEVVRFGATVSVRSLPDGEAARYRIVGVDETDVARGWISWVSPVAKALLSAAVGDRVRAALPSGEKDFEILDVTYDENVT
jgi:transcription elongation factor GreB